MWNVGGARSRGMRAPTGVNTDSMRQPDPKLRALDTPQSVPGERQEVYCTKVGTTHPDENVHRERAHGWHRLGRGRER